MKNATKISGKELGRTGLDWLLASFRALWTQAMRSAKPKGCLKDKGF
jgi:hypothetical protein